MMRESISGLRTDMENKAAREYLMALIDEAERVVSSDPLSEDHDVVSYELRSRGAEKTAARNPAEDLSSCHACSGYLSRTVMPRPILKKDSLVMFITGAPDGSMMLEGNRVDVFRRWWHDSLLLSEGEWSLTSVIKCPVRPFSAENADACREHLRKEMELYSPKALVILGSDVASYMLRKDVPVRSLIGRRFMINHIPAYVSPSLEEYASDPSLRRPIWEGFLFIRKELGLDGRSAR